MRELLEQLIKQPHFRPMVLEQGDVFRAASQEELNQRHAEALEKAGSQAKVTLEKLKVIMQQLGFTETSQDFQDYEVVLTGDNGNLTLELSASLIGDRSSTQRLEIRMWKNPGSMWSGDRMYLSFKLSAPTIIKKIQDLMLPKFAEGVVGWAAQYTPKARYKRYCGICGANIPTGTRHMRMGSGQTICADCVRKAAGALEVSEGVWSR